MTELENSLGTLQQENQVLRDKLTDMKEAVGQAQGAVRLVQGERREREGQEARLLEELTSLKDREARWEREMEERRKEEEELREKAEHLSEVGGAPTVSEVGGAPK